MVNLLWVTLFITFVLVIVDMIFLSETRKVDGFINTTNFHYTSDKNITSEEAFKISDRWSVNISVQEEGVEAKYDCNIGKKRYIATVELIEKLKKTGPLPATIHLNSGTIFSSSKCESVSYRDPSEYLEKVSGFAKIKSFHYYGESLEQATSFFVKVDLTLLKEMRKVEVSCPIDKQGFNSFDVGKTLFPKVYKNTLGTGEESYYCEAVYEMKDS